MKESIRVMFIAVGTDGNTFGAFLQSFAQVDAFQWDIFDAELNADQRKSFCL